MAIAHVGTDVIAEASSVTKTITAGSLVVVCVGWEDLDQPGMTVTDDASPPNTYVLVARNWLVGGYLCQAMFYAMNCTAKTGATITVNWPGSAPSGPCVCAVEFSGVSSTLALKDYAWGRIFTNSTPTMYTNLRSVATGDLMVCSIRNVNGAAVTAQTNWTTSAGSRDDSYGTLVQYRYDQSDGDYKGAGTTAGDTTWACQLAVFSTTPIAEPTIKFIQTSGAEAADSLTLYDVKAGHLVVVYMSWENAAATSCSVSDGSALSMLTVGSQPNQRMQFAYRLSSGAGDKTYTVTWPAGSAEKHLLAMEWHIDSNYTVSLDVEGSATADTGTALLSSNITTAGYDLVLAGTAEATGVANQNPQIGDTEAGIFNQAPAEGHDFFGKVFTTGQSNIHAQATAVGSSVWLMTIAAWKVVSSSTTGKTISNQYSSGMQRSNSIFQTLLKKLHMKQASED